MNYKLISGVVMHEMNPLSFEIPTEAEKAAVKIDDNVKLVFTDDKQTERMWVKIKSVTGNNYTGELDNDPILLDMKLGDPINFKAEHIICTLR